MYIFKSICLQTYIHTNIYSYLYIYIHIRQFESHLRPIEIDKKGVRGVKSIHWQAKNIFTCELPSSRERQGGDLAGWFLKKQQLWSSISLMNNVPWQRGVAFGQGGGFDSMRSPNSPTFVSPCFSSIHTELLHPIYATVPQWKAFGQFFRRHNYL